eukprot:TRINITY_DN7180_c0_g1_i2.p4 TRINITY_DN7180_c0_g1~~TRINITY_DN7180_c0_g1_i2.p4  ORF type:complete len:119 (-),score=7.32 TRINITY_DN7180_c0_g1_i2:493-849(-)
MQREGVKANRDTLRTIVFYAARHGQLDVMAKMVARMCANGLVVDADMCLAIVSAYAKAGRYTDALSAVDTVQSQMCFADGSLSDVELSAVDGLDAHNNSPGAALVFKLCAAERVDRAG